MTNQTREKAQTMIKRHLSSIQVTKEFKKELAQMKLDGEFETYEELIKSLIKGDDNMDIKDKVKKTVEIINKEVFYENELLKFIDDEQKQEYYDNKVEIFEALDLDYRMSEQADFDIIFDINADIERNDSNEIDYHVLVDIVE